MHTQTKSIFRGKAVLAPVCTICRSLGTLVCTSNPGSLNIYPSPHGSSICAGPLIAQVFSSPVWLPFLDCPLQVLFYPCSRLPAEVWNRGTEIDGFGSKPQLRLEAGASGLLQLKPCGYSPCAGEVSMEPPPRQGSMPRACFPSCSASPCSWGRGHRRSRWREQGFNPLR